MRKLKLQYIELPKIQFIDGDTGEIEHEIEATYLIRRPDAYINANLCIDAMLKADIDVN